MFTLWYTVLSWKEYRESICKSLSAKRPAENANKATVQLPTKKSDDSKIASEPPKTISNEPITIPKPVPTSKPFQKVPQTPPVQQLKPASPLPPSSPLPAPPSPIQSSSPPNSQKIPPFRSTPPKNVRSQSPHPMSSDTFSDISFEDEESDPEEDNSVIDSPWGTQKSKKPDDNYTFLNQEIASQRNQLSPGSEGPSGFQNPRNVSPKGPRQT